MLFDLDGTLVDSRFDIADACNHALELHGRARLPVEVVSGFVGDGARALLVRAFALADDDPLLELALSDFRSYYEAHPADRCALLPGVTEVLDVLAANRVALGVVTNKPRAISRLVLERMGLASAFRVLRAGGDGPLKPDPWAVLDALAELGVAADERAWMVGDGPQDVGAGRAAGCFTVAVRNGFASEAALAAAGASLSVASLGELAGRIARRG